MDKKPSFFMRTRIRLNRISIRSRIFSYFLLFTALLLALLWVFQTVLLDDFYRQQKTAMLTSSAEAIARNIENEELETLISRISEQNDVCVLVMNQSLQVLASAEALQSCVIHHMSRSDLLRSMLAMKNNEETIFNVIPLRSLRTSQYDARRFAGYVPPADDGDVKSMIAIRRVTLSSGRLAYVFLDTSITPVNATVETLRNQLIFISAILVTLSFLISLLLTRRITAPILETTRAARELPTGAFRPLSTRISYREADELNLQLTQAAQDLRKVEVMQQELIANISHDLRTPLTLIEGYAEAMRDLPGENSPENMQVIIDEAKRLTTLVNAVLDDSKSGQSMLTPQDFDLTASILGILQRYRKLIEQDGYRIDFRYDEHAAVFADELKVSQVVYNLINNALTYTGENRTVIVTQTVRDGQVKIEIHDNGEGIPPEELPYIWSRYYRGSKPHKRAAIGTGLGLSIVKGILDSHRLPYGVESQQGEGTTFWFLLPVKA